MVQKALLGKLYPGFYMNNCSLWILSFYPNEKGIKRKESLKFCKKK